MASHLSCRVQGNAVSGETGCRAHARRGHVEDAGESPRAHGTRGHDIGAALGIVLTVLFFASDGLQAAENARRAEGPVQRELLVPFEDLNVLLEGPTRRVMLSREQYAELLRKAKQEDEVRAPLDALLVSADYSAMIEQQWAELTGTLVVDVLEDGLHAVPLDLGGVGLREATLDGRDAPIGPSANGRPGLLVEGVGRHELVLRMVAPLGVTAARQVLQFRLPRPPSAAMRLTVPGDVELKSGASVARREVDAAAGVTRFELIPDRGDATLVMTLNSHLRRTEEAVVARSVLVDEVTESYERLRATVTMDVLHRPAERFRFALPDGFEVTEVDSPLLARWDVEEADGERILNVQLQEPTADAVVLRLSAIKTYGPADAAEMPRAWQFPQLRPLDVVGHVAVVGLFVEQRLETQRIVADENELSPIAVSALTAAMPAAARRADPAAPPLVPVVAYYAPQGAFHLSAEFDKPPAALDVTGNFLLVLDDAGQQVHGGLAIAPRSEKLFAIDFTAPAGWRVERVTDAVGLPLAFERFDGTDGADGADGAARIQVRLARGVELGQVCRVNFLATRTPADWLGDWAGQEREVAFPEFAVVGAAEEQGAVAVAVRDDLTVRPTDVSLRPLDESELMQYGLAGTAAHLAYRYEAPGYRATLSAGRTEPRLVARTISLLRIQPGALSARYEVIYNVQQARTRNLSLLLPQTTPSTLSIEGLDGVKLKDFRSEPVDIDGRPMRRWNVQLEEPRRGKIHLAVEFQQPLAESLADYAPPLVVADGDRLVYQSGLVAVEGSAELDVTVKTAASRADVGELAEATYQPGRRLLGVYRFVGQPPAVALDVARAPGYALPSAVVERAELDTYLSPSGVSQTKAVLRLRTKALYLSAELPKDSELWAVWLDGEPLKPQRDATGLLVSLPPTAEELRELKIVYATQVDVSRGKLALPGPRLWLRGDDAKTPVEVPLADLVWRVHLPGGYEIVQSGGTVVPATGQLPKPRPAALDVAGTLYWLAGGTRPYWFVPDYLVMGTDVDYSNAMPGADRAADAEYATTDDAGYFPTDEAAGDAEEVPAARTPQRPPTRPPVEPATAEALSEGFLIGTQGKAPEEILAALASPTEIDFVDTPLTDIVDFLRDYHRIEIQIDRRALEDVGLDANKLLCTKHLKGISLRSALKLMLKDFDLAYIIQDEVLLITTVEEAECRLEVRVYPVADLVTYRDTEGELWTDFDQLIEALVATVDPLTWDETGGYGSMAPDPSYSSLIISQTQEVHAHIAAALTSLRTAGGPGQGLSLRLRAPSEWPVVQPATPLGGESEATRQINAALKEPTQFDFDETPLSQVADLLTQRHHIDIQIDRRALEDVGLDAYRLACTKHLKGISLRSALRLLLRDFDLTYIVADEVLLITTPEEADQQMENMVYPVADLVLRPPREGGETSSMTVPPGGGSSMADFDSLIDPIISTVEPLSWDETGGSGSIAPFDTNLSIVVSNTPEAQMDVAELLETLRIAKSRSVLVGEPPVREQPPSFGIGMGGMVEGPFVSSVIPPTTTPEGGQSNMGMGGMGMWGGAPGGSMGSVDTAPRISIVVSNTQEVHDAQTPTDATDLAAAISQRVPPGGIREAGERGGWASLGAVAQAQVPLDPSQPTPEVPAEPDAAYRGALATEKLQGVRSLAIDLDMAAGAGPVVEFRSLGAGPMLEVTLARRLAHCMLGWGLALAVGLIGLGITGRSAGVKARFVVVVGVLATLVPLLFSSTELARVANMVFYAASLLVPYYLAVGLLRWFAGLFRRRPTQVVTATVVTTATLLLLTVMNTSAHAANPADPSAPFAIQIVPPPAPVDVPNDAILLPYDPDSPTGIRDADKLLVPYDRYVELWNRANPDRKIETNPPPVAYALAGASYTATLEGDDFLLLRGRMTIEVYTDDYVSIPLSLGGGVLAEAQLDGKPARLGESIYIRAAVVPVVGQSNAVPAPQQQAQPAAPSPPGSPAVPPDVQTPISGMGMWQLTDLGRVGPHPATVLPTEDPFGDPQQPPSAPIADDPFADPEETVVPQADDPFAENAPGPSPSGQDPFADDPFARNGPASQTAEQPGVPVRSETRLYVLGKGRHELVLAVRMRLAREGGWRVAEGVLPSAPATALVLTVPEAQTELRLGQLADRRSMVTSRSGERIETALGDGGAVSIQWRAKVAEAQVDRSLTAHSTVVFDVQEDGLRALWQLQLAFGHSERDRFRLGLPEGYLLEKIEGTNVRGWQRDAEHADAIDVELLQPARDSEQFTLHLWRKGPVGQPALAEFAVPSLSVAEAALHDGQLVVRRSPLLDLRTVDQPSVSRVNLGGPAESLAGSADGPESPLGIRPYQAFRFQSSPFTLRLAASPVEAKLAATVQTILRVAEDERTLESRVVLTAEARPVYLVEALLPADLKITNVSAPGNFQWSVIEEDGRQRLSVHLGAGQTGQVALLIDASVGPRGPIEQLELPAIEILGVERQEGEIAVQLDPGLDVRAVALENCRTVLLRQVYAWLDAGQQRATRLGLEFERPDYRGTLRLSARTPEVTCETITNVRVTDLAVEETILLDFAIRNAGIREIAFRLPSGMEDCRIQVPLLRQKRIEPTDEGDLRVWIELQDEVMDQLRVLVENDRPRIAESSSAPIPRVERWPVSRRFVALESAGRDEVVVDPQQTEGLAPLSRQQAEWTQLSAQLGDRITQAYLVEPGADAPRLVFQTKTRQAVETAGAAIGLAETVLVVDANGAYRAKVTYRLDNATEQSLEVELPEGATLWAAEVAGEPVKPASVPGTGNARLARIPLVKTAPGDLDYAVVLVYGGQMPMLGNLSGADFPLMHTKNINVERSQVELFVPKTHRLFGFGGTMGRVSDEADLTAGYVAYAGKKAERLIETIQSKDQWASVRGAYNLKQKVAEMQELQSAQSTGEINANLTAELEANKEVLRRAEQELAKYEQSGKLESGKGAVELSGSNRSEMANRFNEQFSSRAKNVVQDIGPNWRVEEKGAVWLSGDNDFNVLQPEPGENGVVDQSGQPAGQPFQEFGRGEADRDGAMPQSGEGQAEGRSPSRFVPRADNQTADNEPADDDAMSLYRDRLALEVVAGKSGSAALGAGLPPAATAGATPTGLASLALELPEHDDGFYRAYRFTTPRGEVRLTAWTIAEGLLHRALGLAALAAVVFLGLRAARRAKAGGFAWLVSPTATTLWIGLGLAGLLLGVLPVAALVALVAGIVLKVRRRVGAKKLQTAA